MPFISALPSHADPRHVMIANQAVMRPFNTWSHAVMRGPSPLSQTLREMIGTHVAGLANCAFAYRAHLATLRAMGTPQHILDSLGTSGRIPVLPKKEQELLAAADRLMREPGSITREDHFKLQAIGWDEKSIEHMIFVVALFAAMARIIQGYGLADGNELTFAEGGRMLAKHGYRPPSRVNFIGWYFYRRAADAVAKSAQPAEY